MRYFRITYIIVLAILISTLSGCKNKKLNENTYISGQDFQYMYFTQGTNPNMAESKDGYYFFSGYYLYYADKKNMKPVIMCNKPNCLHNAETDPSKVETCDALIKGPDSLQFLSYYDGNLYATSTTFGKEKETYQLIRISLDGTKRKSILKFDFPPKSLAIHRGKIYYTQLYFDKNHKSVYKLYEFDFKKLNSKPHNIYTGTLEGGNIQDLKCYGNNLYFTEFAKTEKAFISRYMRYDLLSHKTNRLFTDNDYEYALDPTIYDNKLYFHISTFNNDGTLNKSKYYTCDLNGKNRKESFGVKYISTTLSDEHYLYIDDVTWSPSARKKDEQSLEIVNKTGNPLDRIKTGLIKDTHNVICGGTDHLFITTNTDNIYKIFYADKKQFGSGKIELKPLFEIEANRMMPAIIKKH